MQPLTETRSLPRQWKSKMELQVLNADEESPNARQTNLQGKQTTPGGEEEEARTAQPGKGKAKKLVRKK